MRSLPIHSTYSIYGHLESNAWHVWLLEIPAKDPVAELYTGVTVYDLMRKSFTRVLSLYTSSEDLGVGVYSRVPHRCVLRLCRFLQVCSTMDLGLGARAMRDAAAVLGHKGTIDYMEFVNLLRPQSVVGDDTASPVFGMKTIRTDLAPPARISVSDKNVRARYRLSCQSVCCSCMKQHPYLVAFLCALPYCKRCNYLSSLGRGDFRQYI